MAVVFDAQSSADITGAAATSFSDSTNLTVGTGANRALLALLAWSSTAAPTGISITWDGVALTPVSTAKSVHLTAGNTQIYGLVNPNSGTKTFAGSWTGSRDFYAAGVAYTGVEQSNEANAFTNGNFANGGSTSADINIQAQFGETALGDANIAVFGAAANFSSITSGTQVFLDNTQTAKACGARIAGSATNVNLTAGLTSANWTLSYCRIVQVSIATPGLDCVTLIGVGG